MENKCNACGEEFDEPKMKGEEFLCPFCGSEDWDTSQDES